MELMPKTSSRQSPKMDSASAISLSLTVRGGRNLTDSRAPAIWANVLVSQAPFYPTEACRGQEVACHSSILRAKADSHPCQGFPDPPVLHAYFLKAYTSVNILYGEHSRNEGEQGRTGREQQHVALAGGLCDRGRHARGSCHAAIVAAKFHRAHEPAPAHVYDRVCVRQLHQPLHATQIQLLRRSLRSFEHRDACVTLVAQGF